MRIATRFAIAVHVLSLLGLEGDHVCTSEGMAVSVGVNPVIIRNVSGLLRRAGLITTRRGVSGAKLAKPSADISLLDVYRAVEAAGDLFAIHPRPNPSCPVGGNIEAMMERICGEAQSAMEGRLDSISIGRVIAGLR